MPSWERIVTRVSWLRTRWWSMRCGCKDLTPDHHERLIRWWQDEIEGTGRVPILSVEKKPEVLRFGGGTDADLRIAVAGIPAARDCRCFRSSAAIAWGWSAM